MFHKKAVLKTLAIFTGKHLCWNLFFDKNAGLQGPSFIKNTLEHRCFLRTLRNFSEHLFWKTSANGCFWDFHLSFFLYNIGSEEDVFSKIKQNKNRSKTQLYKKIWFFMMFFISLFFSFSPLHVRWHLPYMLRKQSWYSLTNEQLILDQWKNYSLILSILYLLLGSLELGNAVLSSAL